MEGSKKPKEMNWKKIMAAKIAAERETHEPSRFLWTDIYANDPDPQVKKNAETHLLLLKAKEDCRQIDL